MIEFSEWHDGRARVCAVRNGDTLDFVSAGLRTPAGGVRLIADQEMARAATLIANDRLIRAPELVPARDLSGTLAALAEAPAGRPCLLPHGVIARHVSGTVARIGSRLEMLAGYPTPAGIVAGVVCDGLRAQVREVARHGQVRLALHDPSGELFPAEEPGIALARVAETPPAGRDEELVALVRGHDGPDGTARLIPPVAEPEPVEPATLLEHARFLAETGAAELERMHALRGMPSMLPVYAHWIERFLAAGLSGEDHDTLVAGARALGRLAGAD